MVGIKKLASFILSFLLLSLPVQAVAQAPSINLSSDLGKIDQVQEGSNGKTILLIQSAHVNYEAQKAVSNLLRSLIQQGFFHLILAEGGWGNISLSYLRSYAPEAKRMEVAERYLREGKISGDEYLDLTSDLDMTIWGIENPDDYRTNMEVFLKFYEVQNQLLEEVKKLESLISQAETIHFSEELKEFSARKRAFQENKSSLLDYLNYLSSLRSNDVFDESFPHLKKLIALTDDSTFDSAKVEVEKKNLMKALAAQVTKLELEQFSLAKDRKSVDDERRYLRLLLDAYEAHASKLPKLKINNIRKCLQAFESMDEASPDQIFKEIVGLEEHVLNQFPLTEEQKRLIQIRHSFELLNKLFSLELTINDYEKIKANPSMVIPAGLQRESINFSLIEKWIPGAVLFYDSARKREAGLIKNAVQKIEETQSQTAALLVGGFHSEHLASEFHQLGYSVVIISPKFLPSADSDQDSRQYFEILKYKWGSGNTVTPNLKLS